MIIFYSIGFKLGTVPPLGLAHPMRTIADRSILGLLPVGMTDDTSYSSSALQTYADLNLENMHLYGGGGEAGLQLLITAKDFLRLSSAEVIDISSPFLASKNYSENDLSTLDVNSISIDGGTSMDYSKQPIKKSRRERLSSNIDTDSDKYRSILSDQKNLKGNLDDSENDKFRVSKFSGVNAKSARKERWLAAVSATGMPVFSSKLLRDYSMLQESKAFFDMLSLYDASPSSFPGELSR